MSLDQKNNNQEILATNKIPLSARQSTIKKMSETVNRKERTGLIGKNNKKDAIKEQSGAHLDPLGLTKCGASSEARVLKAPSAFGSDRILKIAANKKQIDYSTRKPMVDQSTKPSSPSKNYQSFGDLIGARIDYSLAPKSIPRVIPTSTTRYGSNHEWTRNTSAVVVPSPTASFYIDEKVRLQKSEFVDVQSKIKKSQNAAKLAKMIPRNRCST